MTLDQLAEVVRNTSGPAHIKNYTEYLTLQKQIRELNNPKLSGVVHAK